jgi:fucose 4-O-acetylase-like acetyltransferase
VNATATHPATIADSSTTSRAIGWGVVIGAAQGAIALAFWWLPLSTVHALMITMIAAVYVGFAVSDGRTRVIAVEVAVVVAFFTAAAVAVTVTPWTLVGIYLAHGAKDLWQHRHQFVHGTRWWPPFCCAVDIAVAAVIATQVLSGVQFHA